MIGQLIVKANTDGEHYPKPTLIAYTVRIMYISTATTSIGTITVNLNHFPISLKLRSITTLPAHISH